jgi:hypothetical protein
MQLATIETTTGAAAGERFEQRPYREPRLGSGVLCTGVLDPGSPKTLCESPLTTRLRAGVDTLDRPIGQYLCETCGTVFVAIVVSLDPRVQWGDVVVDPGYDLAERPAVSVATALRRTERQPEPVVEVGEERARIEPCGQCGNLIRTDNGEWEAHERTHGED